jgi:hypothetical protein
MVREYLIQAILKYDILIADKIAPESETDNIIQEISAKIPNANFSDIMFYGERERSVEEIVDEALLREKIFQEGGKEAVNAHIEKNYLEAMKNPESSVTDRYAALAILEGMAGHALPELREYLNN